MIFEAQFLINYKYNAAGVGVYACVCVGGVTGNASKVSGTSAKIHHPLGISPAQNHRKKSEE